MYRTPQEKERIHADLWNGLIELETEERLLVIKQKLERDRIASEQKMKEDLMKQNVMYLGGNMTPSGMVFNKVNAVLCDYGNVSYVGGGGTRFLIYTDGEIFKPDGKVLRTKNDLDSSFVIIGKGMRVSKNKWMYEVWSREISLGFQRSFFEGNRTFVTEDGQELSFLSEEEFNHEVSSKPKYTQSTFIVNQFSDLSGFLERNLSAKGDIVIVADDMVYYELGNHDYIDIDTAKPIKSESRLIESFVMYTNKIADVEIIQDNLSALNWMVIVALVYFICMHQLNYALAFIVLGLISVVWRMILRSKIKRFKDQKDTTEGHIRQLDSEYWDEAPYSRNEEYMKAFISQKKKGT